MILKTKLRVKGYILTAGDPAVSGNMSDVEAAESRCIRLVANAGMSLKFTLVKVGLNYVSSGRDYHRLYRKITKAKSKKKKSKL